MFEKYLHTLEYHKIISRLQAHTAFSASHALAENLRPSPNYNEVLRRHSETAEARRLLELKPNLTIGGARDVRPLLEQAYRSMPLLPNDLLDVRRTLIIARDLRRIITRLDEKFPNLADWAYQLEDCDGLINHITQCINDSGEVRDEASPNLSRIRREIDIAHSRLMDRLQSMVASEKYSKYLQEGFITQREGRYVLPVKADFKGRIKGVVHGQSGSGATLFVEPLVIVDLNNAWRELQLQEEDEIRRILLELAALVADDGPLIANNVITLAQLDLIFAKAKYAHTIRATAPHLLDWADLHHPQAHPNQPPPNRILLKAARHPLLEAENVVPISLELGMADTMLVITGPNTGGKTVSLKTIGLMAMMSQAGLQIPAREGSALAVFDGIYADIGDEQSLEQSLSTFSGHMTNIISILETCTDHSLVIFDELGAGTDPIEGAALARAILDHLLANNITTIVATHFAELKAFAYTTSGVVNASMEFNLETLSPTYRLLMGLPGSSNAFTIAQRLGLSQAIITAAQQVVSADSQETENVITQIKHELEETQTERLRLEEERVEAEFYRQKVETRLKQIEAERDEILAQARAEALTELEATRHALAQLKAEALEHSRHAAEEAQQTALSAELAASTSKLDDLERDLSAKIVAQQEAQAAKTRQQEEARRKRLNQRSKRLNKGDEVEVPRFNATGVIVSLNEAEVEVQVGHFRATLKRSEVIPLAENPNEEKPPQRRQINSSPVESPGLELDLRGQISEDALRNLDLYLDQAYLAGLPFVRIIHGKGTGVLRQVVRQALQNHALISSYKPGGPGEGGDGVSVAKLALN